MCIGILADEKACPNGRRVAVGGIVLVRQRPATANGILFITLEDETGVANLVVKQGIYERFRGVLRHSVCVMVWGKVERAGQVVHVLVEKAEDLARVTDGRTEIASASRDFH